MRLRRRLRGHRYRNLRPPRVQRLRERLNKALRRARHQTQLHVVPVRTHRVVHHRPALHRGLPVRLAWKHNPIGRLPHRHFADVAHPQRARARAQRVQRQVPQPVGVRGRKQLQIAVQLPLQVRVQRPHAQGRRQLHHAHRAGARHQRQIKLRHRRVRARTAYLLIARLNRHQPSLQHAARRAQHLHPLPAQRLKQLRRRRVVAHPQGQRLQLLGQRRGGVVIHSANPPAALIQHRQRLQHIVQLRRSEINAHPLVAVHRAGVLKVADAVFVEHHLAHRQVLGHARGSACGRAGRIRSGCCACVGWVGGLGRERANSNSKGNQDKSHRFLPCAAECYIL